jgi:hypothetical protein
LTAQTPLAHPAPHRLHAIAELATNPIHRPVIGAQLRPQGVHHPHRSGLLLRAVPTRRRLPWRLFFRHDSILVSKVRSRQDCQSDSPTPKPVRETGLGLMSRRCGVRDANRLHRAFEVIL